MSEAYIPPFEGQQFGRLTLVSQKSETDKEHEAATGSVLFDIKDRSLSDEDLQSCLTRTINTHFTLDKFRKMDRVDQPRYILRTLLSELAITADTETLQSFTDRSLNELSDDEKEIVAYSAYIGEGILNDAMAFWQKLDSDAAREFRGDLEDFIEAHEYDDTNLLRALQLARKKVTGHDDAMILAQRYAKTMLFLMTEVKSKPE